MQMQQTQVTSFIPVWAAVPETAEKKKDRTAYDPDDPNDHPNKPKVPPSPEAYPPPGQGPEYDPQAPGVPGKKKQAANVEAEGRKKIVDRMVTEADKSYEDDDEETEDEENDSKEE